MMYRLLNSKSLSQNNFKILTSPRCWDSCTNCLQIRKTFSLFYINNWEQNEITYGTGFSTKIFSTNRLQSTTPNAYLLNTKIKKKRRFKGTNYAELIEINDRGPLTKAKACVQKLKSKQLTEFIEKGAIKFKHNNKGATTPPKLMRHTTGTIDNSIIEGQKYSLINLGTNMIPINDIGITEAPLLFVGKGTVRLEKGTSQLQEIIDSYKLFKEFQSDLEFQNYIQNENIALMQTTKNLTDMMDPSFAVEEEIENLDEENQFECMDLDVNVSKMEKTTKAKPKESPLKISKYKTLEHEQLAKQKSLAQNLHVYLEVCVNGGMTNRGLATLLNYRYRCKRSKTKLNIISIKLYNILLTGYAEKANYAKIKEVLDILKEDKIARSAQTYAAIFECLGRSLAVNDCTKLMQKYHNDAISDGFTLNDIMNHSKFIADQREIVLDAIHLLEPTFIPEYTAPTVLYNNILLFSLNKHVVPITENIKENFNQSVPGSEIMNSKHGFSTKDLVSLAEQQITVETNSFVTIKSIEKFPEIDDTVLHYRQKLEETHKLWRANIISAFHRDMNTLRAQAHSKGNRSIVLFPYLRSLNAEQYADILMHEIRSLAEGSETFSLTIGQLYKQIGNKVQARYHMERKMRNGILDKTNEIYGEYCKILSSYSSSDNPRQCWQRIVYQFTSTGPSLNITDEVWPMAVLMGVGRFLYQILMRDIKIDVNIARNNNKPHTYLPAFYTLFRNEGKFVKEEVKPHPVLVKLYRASQQQTLTFDANTVPMICPPQPWSTPTNGGYLLARSDLIRLPQQSSHQWERINKTPNSNMYPALDSLNQLANIAWRVNTPVLDIILEVFNSGGSKTMNVPQPPSALAPLEFKIVPDGPKLAKSEIYQRFRQKLMHRRKQSEMYSLWCDTLYRLSLANHYRDKVFWLPHNMDFRGRVYPIPPHLNHLGSDLARSLLVFNQTQPLGTDGFDWLKLHCINLTGLKKKCAVADRLKYVEEIMDDIIDSADNPLLGRKWWCQSDEPWQTLATCIEIAKVARCPDPTKFMSSFPIHQDGSCNGLQHYAALGRDTAGAISVNLAPCTIPQDVYSDVAALVEESRKLDAENGVEIAQILDGFIQRKVIKQTVMTTVYGVTRFGARCQIARQLKDVDTFPKDSVWPASSYLTTKTFESLREMFTSTREIQDWFTHCARLIAAIGGHNVEWITPLGLPIVQPYNRFDKKMASNKSNRITDNVSTDLYMKPNVLKQKNAFPPNFIHSLDSSHMMLTSLHCDKKGLTFMSVHDCYWTHASSVCEMNKICREQFVALHSQPILEDLSKYLVQKYSYNEKAFLNDGSVMDSTKHKLNRVLRQLPSKGNFDLKHVMDSVYFFS